MLGFLGMFGRAREIRALDKALRALGMHPALVPDAMKIAVVRLHREENVELAGDDESAAAAALLAFCITGPDGFADANGARAAETVEARIRAAMDAGDSLDARLVMLTWYARVLHDDVVDRCGLEVAVE